MELERRGGDCDHRNCPPGNCLAYTPESMEPDEWQLDWAKAAIANGWISISTKRRLIARLITPWPGLDMIDPAWRDHPYGKMVADRVAGIRLEILQRIASGGADPHHLVETQELSLVDWRAFKKAGGQHA